MVHASQCTYQDTVNEWLDKNPSASSSQCINALQHINKLTVGSCYRRYKNRLNASLKDKTNKSNTSNAYSGKGLKPKLKRYFSRPMIRLMKSYGRYVF